MTVIFMLLPIALLMGLAFLLSFIFAARAGQFDDLETPSYRVLLDDQPQPPRERNEKP